MAAVAERGYEQHKEQARLRQAFAVRVAQELTPLPPVEEPERRMACEWDLGLCLREYFPSTFYKPFSPDHETVIKGIESIMFAGGRQVDAVYRGFGKSSIADRGILWGALYGHRPYLAIGGATGKAANKHLATIVREIETNPRLAADFPEVCYPIHRLDRRPQRQLRYCAELVRLKWTGDVLALPVLPGSQAADVAITAVSIGSGNVRGPNYLRADGRTVRPGFYLIDDPQTNASAKSGTQTVNRLDVVQRDIIHSASHHGAPPAALIMATVIEQADMIDQLLEGDEYKAWSGRRIPLIRTFPKAWEKLWLGKYAELRRGFGPTVEGDKARAAAAATAYYQAHREVMDAGAEVSWDGCFRAAYGEVSALQHAANIYIDDGEFVFASECQQRPEIRGTDAEEVLTVAQVLAQLNGRKRREVASEREIVVAHVDIHNKLLYWLVLALSRDWTGEVVDCGAYPDQGRKYFTLRDARVSLRHKAPGAGVDGAIRAGLVAVLSKLLALRLPVDDKSEPRPIAAIGIDIGYKPAIVEDVLRELDAPRVLVATRGQGFKAVNRPIREYTRKPGQKLGDHWWIPSVRGTKDVRHLRVDTNFWKRFAQRRLQTAAGDPGALTLWGKDPAVHRLLADHLAKSEYAQRVEASGRVIWEYQPYPQKPDNHWFDNLVGSFCLASYRKHFPLQAEGKRPRRPRRRKAKVRYL